MKAKTEQFLYLLLYTVDTKMMRPTLSNLTSSFEEWAYRNGFMRQIQRLEAQQFLERTQNKEDTRTCRLTEKGRLFAMGGRDPEKEWARKWDGLWRLALFDVPIAANRRRDVLRMYLLANGFGCLQRSAWISPHPFASEATAKRAEEPDVGALIFLEAKPAAGETNEALVSRVWDFEKINRLYANYIEILQQRPRAALKTLAAAEAFKEWNSRAHKAWLSAISIDPLLPNELLPPGYLGQNAFRLQLEANRLQIKQLRTFKKTW